ncbi:DUF1127 domain-containing protein [Limibaculum sp. M0105]|uniref:DUF1127 domain-containing protein n=1 Tax=Thermohalobaculum xanthum TaxID=2753746 RepID=A0A8J7SE03_9RHOB|nr:DUF1127 domain-containing protein [Thermohalobaculum xanthum]MBK0399181.1 DUF1127 domain-containing protein [Thermohalobaculum xanthum]
MTSTDNRFVQQKSRFAQANDLMASGRAALSRLARALRLWSARAHQRQHLAELSPERLKDIGVSADAANAEAAKPFWQA